MPKMTYENLNKAVYIGCDHLGIKAHKVYASFFRSDDGGIGWCYGDTDEQHIEINQNIRGEDWIEVLGHELVHAYQYQMGELEDAGSMQLYWHGNKFVVYPWQTHEEYMRQPWERQAYRQQAEVRAAIMERW